MYFPMKFLIKLILNLFLLLFMDNKLSAQNLENKYPNNVGDIEFDSKLDNPDFKICHPELSYQYYNFNKGFQYKGEKYEILELWKKHRINSILEESGYITIRFIVNCEGKTGRFRIQQMSQDYKELKFNENFVAHILEFVKRLDGWLIGNYRGENVDYYQYLTFKVNNGIVTEILP